MQIIGLRRRTDHPYRSDLSLHRLPGKESLTKLPFATQNLAFESSRSFTLIAKPLNDWLQRYPAEDRQKFLDLPSTQIAAAFTKQIIGWTATGPEHPSRRTATLAQFNLCALRPIHIQLCRTNISGGQQSPLREMGVASGTRHVHMPQLLADRVKVHHHL